MPRRTAKDCRFHGFLVIDKPAGWTSHDVVARVRRLLGERHIGHAGTLDPAATGVLPLAVGDATKTLEFLTGADKTYLAEFTLGIETDSYDGDGLLTKSATVPDLTADDVQSALATFAGEQLQIPPMVSALKVGGQRLYDLARAGIEIPRAARPITIHEVSLVAWNSPIATVVIACSSGTYVRSLAADLGEKIGCGAHLSDLVRLQAGPFGLEDAWRIEELAELDIEADWENIAIHPDAALPLVGSMLLEHAGVVNFRHGRVIPDELAGEVLARVYDESGNWIGLARGTAGTGWQPVRVVTEAA